MFEIAIILKNKKGFSVELFVHPDSKVKDVREKLLAKRTFTDPQAQMMLGYTQMDDERSLQSYGITDSATIYFVDSIPTDTRDILIDQVQSGRRLDVFNDAFQGDLPITIQYKGQEYVFLVKPDTMVGFLKIQLEQVVGLHYDHQILSYPEGRMVLENIGTLEEYVIGEGGILLLTSDTQTTGGRMKTKKVMKVKKTKKVKKMKKMKKMTTMTTPLMRVGLVVFDYYP
jgi:hypothetical protein